METDDPLLSVSPFPIRLKPPLTILLPRVLAMKPDDPCVSAQYSYDAAGKLVIEFAGD